MSIAAAVVRAAIAALGVLLVLILGVLSGCGSEDEGAGGGSDTTLRPGERAQGAQTSANVAEVAASGIDEAAIRTHLMHLTGLSPAPLESSEVTCNQADSIDDALLRASEVIGSPIELNDVCLSRSDHQNFWDAGFPAAVLTDGSMYDGYPWYHGPGDTVDKLDISYLRSMIQLTAPEDQRH